MPAVAIPVASMEGLLERLDQDDREGDALISSVRKSLKFLMETTLELGRTSQLGRGRYERSAVGSDCRNGYYTRDLETGFGLIERLRVPRLRRGAVQQTLFARYQRRRGDVERFVRSLFFAGVSTRGVGEVLEILLGFAPSATAVSRMVASIDREVKAYHQRLLGDGFVYLFLDGLTVTLKEAPAAKKRLVLVAYGITLEGKRVLLDFRLADSESQAEWDRFLRSLIDRGLLGQNLKLITTDGGTGLRAAVRDAYPNTPLQLCWVHKLRNVDGHLHRRNQQPCLQGARKIYQAPNRRAALHAFKEWQETWQTLEPDAVRCLAKDLESLLTFLGCPQEHRKAVRTTNYIERLIRELRRRTRLMGAFADRMSCERLFFGVVRRLARKWEARPALPGFTQKT
ncbi:MAG TPA: IS256 family transposase [Anaerolineales bacterium]